MLDERTIILIVLACIWLFFPVILVYKEDGYASAIIQSLFLFYWSYMGHIYAHNISLQYPFNIINPHVSLHHSECKDIPRWFELMIESFTNFFSFYILYIVQSFIGVRLFNIKLILYAAFLYIGLHIFYYTIITHNKYHQVHHDTTLYNFSPEIFDIIFGTKKMDEKYDKISLVHEAIPALMSYYLVKNVFKFFK